MPVHNADIARVFDEIADLLELQGANVFRVRAHRQQELLDATKVRAVDTLAALRPMLARTMWRSLP